MLHPRLEQAEFLVEELVWVLTIPCASPFVLLHQPPPKTPISIRLDDAVFTEHRSLTEVPAPSTYDPVEHFDPVRGCEYNREIDVSSWIRRRTRCTAFFDGLVPR